MKGFEELLKLNPADVVSKTFISVDEFKAITEKKFELFSKPKATGFIKILEREYNLDLSDWIREFNASREEFTKTKENIFVTPPPEDVPLLDNKLYLFLITAFIVAFAMFFIFYPSDNNSENATEVDSQIVKEAEEVIKNNEIKEANLTEEVQQLSLSQEVVKVDVFTLLPQKNLWIGIKYLDNNKNESITTKNIIELDPSRDQIITLGHGYFMLTLNEQVIEPKSPSVHKITYKNKEVTVYKVPTVEKTTQAEAKAELTEQNITENQENAD